MALVSSLQELLRALVSSLQELSRARDCSLQELSSALTKGSRELSSALCKSSRELLSALFISFPAFLPSFVPFILSFFRFSFRTSLPSRVRASCVRAFELSFFFVFVRCLRAFVRSCIRAFVHSCIRSFSIAGLCCGPRGLALLHSKTIAESLSAPGAKNNCATGHCASSCATFSLCQN